MDAFNMNYLDLMDKLTVGISPHRFSNFLRQISKIVNQLEKCCQKSQSMSSLTIRASHLRNSQMTQVQKQDYYLKSKNQNKLPLNSFQRIKSLFILYILKTERKLFCHSWHTTAIYNLARKQMIKYLKLRIIIYL